MVGRVGLGVARLRVIDLETGDQPIANEDGSVHAVLNGEIYNFPELRRDLTAPAPSPRISATGRAPSVWASARPSPGVLTSMSVAWPAATRMSNTGPPPLT
jgi:hypothetical protein